MYLIKNAIPKKLFKFLQPAYHYVLSWLAAVIYGFPSEKLIIIGITGTTGKTTSVALIAKILEQAGFKVGYTSTAMFNDGRRRWLNDKKMTMVGRFFTQKILRQMVKHGCQYAIIETTSQGIQQYRHCFINYDILVFTGLYPEHIEAHGSFDNYRQSKEKLFAYLRQGRTKYINEQSRVAKSETGLQKIELERIKKTIIVNGDDKYRDSFLKYWAQEKIAYLDGKECPLADDVKVVRYNKARVSSQGTEFNVLDKNINLRLIGAFNAVNAMSAVCVGLARNIPLDIIKQGLEKIKGVAGRMEQINEGQDFIVIVDYAFEPKAIAHLYEAINFIPHQRVIHVLGAAGGGRDIAKRPRLGQLAAQQADYVIITNEDPYDDDPEIIIDQVALGAENGGKKIGKNLFKILDRREAIKKAFELAAKDDLVLITGKGSEQAICSAGGEKIPWDDRAVVRGLLNAL